MPKTEMPRSGKTGIDKARDPAYEAEQRLKIAAWSNAAPSMMEKASGLLTAPAGWAARRFIPHVMIETVLRGADWLAQKTLIDRQLLNRAKVTGPEELASLPLQRLDKLAGVYHRWALGLATLEGGASGAVGLFGMVVDVPSLILLTLRTVRGIGACYGYTDSDEAERRFVLSVIGAAGANNSTEKRAAIASLHELEEGFVERTLKAVTDKAAQHTLGKEAAVAVLRDLAGQLGINLTQRKTLQAIPILGIAIGAAVNWSFINDAAWAARRSYQQRWLRDRDAALAFRSANAQVTSTEETGAAIDAALDVT